MKIAYFTNQYPKVSHSFIRREIHALEKSGFEILRFSVRGNPEELVDRADIAEEKKTRLIVEENPVNILIAFLLAFLSNPIRFYRSAILGFRVARNSGNRKLRHIFYFIEACILLRWLRHAKVDHIHVHFGTNPATVAMLAHVMGGPRYSFTIHGPEEFDRPESLSLGEKIKHSSFVVAISSFTKSQIYRWSSYEDWRKIKVVHCWAGDFFLKANQSDVPADHRLVCVGRICEQKGQLLLLDAIAILKGEGIDVKLVLAGDGPMRSEAEHRIQNLGIGDNIRITGWLSGEQIKEELEQSRTLVLPSFAEGLPVVIMEALALGRPVITTYIAGIPELVIDGKNGWLVPAGSIESLAAAMKECLAAEPARLTEMGRAGREAVSRRHSEHIEARKLIDLFKDASAEAGDRAGRR